MKVLIVGSGLAGICAAHHLLEKGCEVTVIDNTKNVSTAVAAGIINPIVFRRTTMSWRVGELITYGYPFYQQLEKLTERSFFRQIPIRRLFSHEQERETWLKKQTQEGYSEFLNAISDADLNFPLEQNTFGTGVVKQTASVDPKEFLAANHNFFKAKNMLKIEDFNFDDLDPVLGKYQEEIFDYILFCEGKDARYNPFFSYLPLSQTKGEVLEINLENTPTNESLNRKCFLMPQAGGTWKTGSTYVWKTDDNTPTNEGRDEILKNLASITSEIPVIVNHEAGVRPTVIDRRPILGKHSEFPKLVIFNGLGTKGFMIAPLVSKELTAHLLEGSELSNEVDIRRF